MQVPIDLEKQKREQTRWLILLTLNAARPIGANESLILQTINDVPLAITQRELRRELDYLEERSLVRVTGNDSPLWSAELTRYGIDLVEYTCECEAGIARPKKYWS